MEFDCHAIEPPQGDWGYELDDHNIVFGPGWWPFRQPGRGGTLRPARSVRLAPDIAFMAWRNLYAAAQPASDDTPSPTDARVRLTVTLFAGQRGARRGPTGGGGYVVRGVDVLIDLHAGTVQPPAGLPPQLHAQALGCGRRALRYLRDARTERRTGADRPRTAHERNLTRLDECEPAPPGTRIELTSPMLADPDPVPVGTQGTVTRETRDQLGVDWDNGRRLFLLRPADRYRVLPAHHSTNSGDRAGHAYPAADRGVP